MRGRAGCALTPRLPIARWWAAAWGRVSGARREPKQKRARFFFSSPRARARPDPLSSSCSLSLLFQSDVIDIVHVAKIMAPESTVFHGVPGTSYSFHDEPLKDVQSHLATVREWLAAEVVPVLTAAGARHEVHLFVEKTTAPAADVAATITCVADSVDAPLIVMVSPGERERERGGNGVGGWGGWAWSPPSPCTLLLPLTFSCFLVSHRPSPTRRRWTSCLWGRSRTKWPNRGGTWC